AAGCMAENSQCSGTTPASPRGERGRCTQRHSLAPDRGVPVSDVLILGYHAVSEDWASDLSVTPAALERQLRHLVKRGYRGARFQEAVTDPPAARTLSVTFDDAYRSVLALALPILDRLDLPATVFVPTRFASGDLLASWSGVDVHLKG